MPVVAAGGPVSVGKDIHISAEGTVEDDGAGRGAPGRQASDGGLLRMSGRGGVLRGGRPPTGDC